MCFYYKIIFNVDIIIKRMIYKHNKLLMMLFMKTPNNIKRVSIDIPINIMEQIDIACKEQFIARRKWFIDAALAKIEKDKIEKIDSMVRR